MAGTVERVLAERVGPPQLPSQQPPAAARPRIEAPFAEHLRHACEEVGCRMEFSGHAQERVVSREIDLKAEQLTRIDRAVDSVAAKGARRALVMLDDLALIVGVERRTVITVVDAPALRENVFTSIDAAVIA